MKCVTIRKQNPYTQIENTLITNPDLSCRAFKLLCIGLSRPENWKFYKSEIEKHFKEGKATVREALKELRSLGYLHSFATRSKNGTMTGHVWFWLEEPVSEEEFKKRYRSAGLPHGGLTAMRFDRHAVDPHDNKERKTPSKKDSKKEKESRSSAPSLNASRLASSFYQKILENDPKAKPPNLEKWGAELDRMQKLDGRTWEEIEGLIIFAQEDEFWRGNCLSPAKLRKKATQLTLQMHKAPTKAEVKADRNLENHSVALDRWSTMNADAIRFGLTAVRVFVNGQQHDIKYTEHGFVEQVESALRKGGHK